MRDGVGVPAFGEHGHRHDTSNRLAQTAFLAHGVHNFPQQFLVGKALGLLAVSGALDNLAPEAVDLVSCHVAEVVIKCLAGFQLLAIDQQRIGPGELVAMLVEIPKQRQASVFERGGAIFVRPVETGDEIVDQLGCGRVVADHDEARRNPNAGGAPQLVGLFIVTVEGLQRGL